MWSLRWTLWWRLPSFLQMYDEISKTLSSMLLKCLKPIHLYWSNVWYIYPSYLLIHHIHLSINQLVNCICNHPSSIQVWRYRCVTVILSQFVSVNVINAHKYYDQVFFYIMSCGMNNDEAVVLKVRWWLYMRC